MNEFVQDLYDTIHQVADNNGIVSECLQASATDKDSDMANTTAEKCGCLDKSETCIAEPKFDNYHDCCEGVAQVVFIVG